MCDRGTTGVVSSFTVSAQEVKSSPESPLFGGEVKSLVGSIMEAIGQELDWAMSGRGQDSGRTMSGIKVRRLN
jgi:hypothetical protein